MVTPSDDSRESRICAGDDEERSEIFDSNWTLRYVDREANEAHNKAGYDEGPSFLDSVRPPGEDEENDS